VSRCLLDVTKTAYENKVFSIEEWNKMEKPSKIYEYGTLPVLEFNGRNMSQDHAIEIFLARKLGFLGSNPDEEYDILSIILSTEEFYKPIAKYGMAVFSKESKELLDKRVKEINDTILSSILPVFERRFTNKKGKYIVGDKLSLADIFMTWVIHLLFCPLRKGVFDSSKKFVPKLIEYVDNLRKNELKIFFTGKNFTEENLPTI